MKSPFSKYGCQQNGKVDDVVFAGSAFADLIAAVGHVPPETGGLLLGSRENFIVQKFIFDESGSRSYSAYDPDVAVLNKIVKREWKENGLELIGWAHSHPRGVDRLSGDYGNGNGDLAYLNSIFRAMPTLPKFIVPILFSSDDGPLTVYPFVAYRENVERYHLGCLKVLPARANQDAAPTCFKNMGATKHASGTGRPKAEGEAKDEPAPEGVSKFV